MDKITNEREEITTNTTEIQLVESTMKNYIPTTGQPGRHGQNSRHPHTPKPKPEEIENVNRPTTSKEIESVIKNLPTVESPGPHGLPGESYHTFKVDLISILLKHSKKSKWKETSGVIL